MESFATFIKYLERRLQQPLPGLDVQLRLVPATRLKELRKMTGPLNARQSSVLVLFFPYKNDIGILLIKRATDKSVHSGQISFPGGKKEDIDPDLKETALRETFEEVGIASENITIIGSLSRLYIPPSNFDVYPFVGYVDSDPVVTINSEVEKVLKVPLSELSSPDLPVEKIIKGHDGQSYAVPCYFIQNEIIWGATAMMLSELLAVILE
jgi:8-oxo-dGTP pyrophosphatase MutT (NUDIX family)